MKAKSSPKKSKSRPKAAAVEETAAVAAAESPAPAKGVKKKTRGRVGNVRGLILELLASGPMSSPALVAKGGFSPASVFLNMKSLKQAGLVSSERQGREVLFSLTGAAGDAATPPAVAKRGRPKGPVKALPTSKGTVPAKVPSNLHDALSGLSERLAPIEGLSEKLKVLESLKTALPAPIGAVLTAISGDLQRLG